MAPHTVSVVGSGYTKFGGLKAKGYPVGAAGVPMHALSFRQLTGQADHMQLEGTPELSLVFNMGGTGVVNHATILDAKRA